MFNASTLSHNPYSIQIDKTIVDLTKNIFSKIKDANQNQNTSMIYELPFYFESLLEIVEKDIINIDNIRDIIWGRIIELLVEREFIVSINLNKKEEKCHLFINWKTSLDKHIGEINKYKNLIKKFTK